MSETGPLPLLNTYEVETEDGITHIVAFLDTVRAGAEGITTRKVVGRFEPTDEGTFDAESFEANPEFIAAFIDFMNDVPARSEEVLAQARMVPSQWLYIIDPRDTTPEDEDPPASNIAGCYAVDDTGQIVPNSFQYNADHLWFCPRFGISGMLGDRRFYDWLNAEAASS